MFDDFDTKVQLDEYPEMTEAEYEEYLRIRASDYEASELEARSDS